MNNIEHKFESIGERREDYTLTSNSRGKYVFTSERDGEAAVVSVVKEEGKNWFSEEFIEPHVMKRIPKEVNSPKLHDYDVSERIMKMSYLGGTELDFSNGNKTMFYSLGRQLGELHSLSLSLSLSNKYGGLYPTDSGALEARETFHDFVEKYFSKLGSELDSGSSPRLRVKEELKTVEPPEPCLSHGDPHPSNVINSSGGVYLIDWENAFQSDGLSEFLAFRERQAAKTDNKKKKTTIRKEMSNGYFSTVNYDLSDRTVALLYSFGLATWCLRYNMTVPPYNKRVSEVVSEILETPPEKEKIIFT